MFDGTDFLNYKIKESNAIVGEMQVNIDLINSNSFYQPIVRDKSYKEILVVGERNNYKTKEFIIASMKDYYDKLMNASGSEKNNMLTNYNKLYSLWKELYNYQKSNSEKLLNDTYDIFTYSLYLLGYEK